jgi:hypothetical protein
MSSLPRFSALALAATILSGCATPQKGSDFDRYLDQFSAVRASGEELYLKASVIAEQRGAETNASAGENKKALEARFDALRLVDRYNRLLTGLARGEDPKVLKSEMSGIGGKLADYKPGAATQGFALAAAVPYLGIVMEGASVVQDALAKRRFLTAVKEAQKPISAILDILLADSKPLEELIVQGMLREQDPYRAQIDALGGRYYRALQGRKASDALKLQLDRHNALRKEIVRAPIEAEFVETGSEVSASELETLGGLVDQVEADELQYRGVDSRVAAQRAVFTRYRASLEAAKGSLAALNRDSEEERAHATDQFNEEALDLRRETVRLKEDR